MANRLEGKVALITGAGSVGPGWGNGRAISVIFAEEGAQIFAVDQELERMAETVERIAERGGDVVTHQADVTSGESIEQMVRACLDRYGRIDVLVNNVGGSAHGGAAELDPALFDQQIAYNLTSVFRVCHEVLPHMIERRAGAIVNIASVSGQRYSGSPQVGYASSKAAVIQLTKVTAVQYAPYGIRVNVVVPGQLHTPMVEYRLAGQRSGGDVESLLAQRQARIPLGFAGDGRDTAYAALFLASDEARFVTGVDLVVDGGMTLRCD
jgi:NAD(P)-dependent dehydrogenase (short-subunit alcohol dehydrogenase family)